MMYYLIQWTWGIIMNLIGLCVYTFAKIRKWPIKRYRKAIEIICPSNKIGGVSLGMFIMRGVNQEQVMAHEYGHTIQNLRFGPAFLFAIGIPSFIRCGYYTLMRNKKTLKPYDSIWFEGQATSLGHAANCEVWSWL